MDYVKNADKTDGGQWVRGYCCDPANIEVEFLYSKRQYAHITGREQGKRNVIAYHLRQSFKPGEITAEKANLIGYQLALKLTKGYHAFVVCTHVDKNHVHSHIIFNSTRMDNTKKFRNFWNSSLAVRRISDQLCLENGLSIIEKPGQSGLDYSAWQNEKKRPTWHDKLEQLIDIALESKPTNFADLIKLLNAAGCEVKNGKHLALKKCLRFHRWAKEIYPLILNTNKE